MELVKYKNIDGYTFYFEFANNDKGEVNIEPLVGQYVKPNELSTANLNKEWGCLEFKKGLVDIEPKTLYKFFSHSNASSSSMEMHHNKATTK